MSEESLAPVGGSSVKVLPKASKSAPLSAILISILSIAFTFLLVEGAFRAAIAFEVGYFMNPSLYSYPFKDNYWKLSYRWQQQSSESVSSNLHTDPFLGWSPKTSPENPLGLIGMAPYQLDGRRPAILFYGDSFVAGKTELPEDNIPNQLSGLLPHTAVYNYGVSNYGVDQIYLRLRQSHHSFAQPTLLVGIFTLDIDRSMISVRSGAPKPHFTLGENDALVLHGIEGIPLNTTPADWLRQWHEDHPPIIPSYAWAFLAKQIKTFGSGGDWLATEVDRGEIEALNGRLITEMSHIAQTREVPIHFVLFYTRRELDTTYWRETFLLEHLAALGVPVLDTKPLLIEAAQQVGVPLNDYYFADGGHTNELGNRVIAEALQAQLVEK